MAAPLDPRHLDDAISRYLAGEPEPQIIAATGVSRTSLHRERGRRGIPPRRNHVLPVTEIVEAYVRGESECSLSSRYGVSRAVIAKRLDGEGVQRRSHSDAGLMRAAQMTPEQRSAQAAAAHKAVRGVPLTDEHLNAQAAGRERVGRIGSDGERFLLDQLLQRGLEPIPQKAIGRYNVDFALPPVAVEVLGGGWHAAKQGHARRTPDILDAGWHLLFVWNHEGDSAITERAADYVVAFLDEIRREPPTVGQYRVISGSGQLLSAGSADDGQFALVPPPRGSVSSRP